VSVINCHVIKCQVIKCHQTKIMRRVARKGRDINVWLPEKKLQDINTNTTRVQQT